MAEGDLRVDVVVEVVGGARPTRNMRRSRGGLVSKADRLLYQSTVGLRVIKKKEEDLSVDVVVEAVWERIFEGDSNRPRIACDARKSNDLH